MRRHFLDNLRYAIVLSVIFYHICYLLNNVGIITNVTITGIPAMDAVEYLLYPWFMVTLFTISGICARYSLQKQTDKEFLRSKVRRQLIPSLTIVPLFGWTTGWVTNRYLEMFSENAPTPGIVKYLIFCLIGIGVLWYLHELLLGELLLVLIRKLDRKERLWRLGGKANLPVLCLLALALWGSAQILNTPLITCYRHGIYLFAFFIGYFVFSHDHVQETLSKHALPLLAIAAVLAVVYTVTAWGENYTDLAHLRAPLTNLYAWFALLAVLGAGKRFWERETAFTRYMAPRSFGFYVLHYPLTVLLTYLMDWHLHLPAWSLYLLLPVLLVLILPLLVTAVKRIPIVRRLILGEK